LQSWEELVVGRRQGSGAKRDMILADESMVSQKETPKGKKLE
jgi:hypothetical protein